MVLKLVNNLASCQKMDRMNSFRNDLITLDRSAGGNKCFSKMLMLFLPWYWVNIPLNAPDWQTGKTSNTGANS